MSLKYCADFEVLKFELVPHFQIWGLVFKVLSLESYQNLQKQWFMSIYRMVYFFSMSIKMCFKDFIS